MSISIILAVILGILAGLFAIPKEFSQHLGLIIDIGLCGLLFFVGMDIGRNKEILQQIKAKGFRILLVPLGVALGSIT